MQIDVELDTRGLNCPLPILKAKRALTSMLSGQTLRVVATDAVLTKPQAQRLAQVSHDGLARAINPVHTMLDGDTLFALATGQSGKGASMLLLATLAAEVTARAVVNAVWAAQGITIGTQRWPAVADLTNPTT